MISLHTIVDDIALETESFARDMRVNWYGCSLGQRVALIFSTTMLLSNFLPWISLSPMPTAIGLTGGGIIHVNLALIGMSNPSRLKTILIGIASILASIAVLIYYIWLHATFDPSMHVRYGFYLTTLSGVGISTGGILQFFRSCPNFRDG